LEASAGLRDNRGQKKKGQKPYPWGVERRGRKEGRQEGVVDYTEREKMKRKRGKK